MNEMNKPRRRRMHPREVALRKRQADLQLALYFMRGRCHVSRVDLDPCYEMYAIATECVERELLRVRRELI